MKQQFNLMLDSGAHHFFEKHVRKGTGIWDRHLWNWEAYKSDAFCNYTNDYIKFLKQNKHIFDVYVVNDAIYDPEVSYGNYCYMKYTHGLNPLPVYHYAEDIKWFKLYMKETKYIGISGLGQGINKKDYIEWADEVFHLVCSNKDRLPTHKIHGFALTSVNLMKRYPFYCVTEEEHEVLTKKGWKKRKDLKTGEKILSFNKGEAKWEKIQNIHAYDVQNMELTHLWNRNFETIVTPEHNWQVCRVSDRGKNYIWKQTKTLNYSNCINRAPLSYQFRKNPILTNEQVALLAWIWTDGTIGKRKNYKHNSVRIYQSLKANPKKCDIIRNLLIKSKENYCEYKVNSKGAITFELYGNVAKWVEKFAPKKKLPINLPLLLTKKQAKIFLKYSIMADGTKSGLKRKKGFEIVVSREIKKENLEVLRIICLLLGITTSVYGQGGKYKGLRSSSVDYVYVSSMYENKINYTGTIWCPEVPSNAFFVKCKDHIYVTGNSVDSSSWVQYSRFGIILMPKLNYGKYNYLTDPLKLFVSTRSPKTKIEGEHYNNSPEYQKKFLRTYLKHIKIPFGKSEFKIVDKDYKLQSNEKLVEEYKNRTKKIEIIIKKGVINRHEYRDMVNFMFFTKLGKELPLWPWAWRKKQCSNLGLL
jgi:hypothetical protein